MPLLNSGTAFTPQGGLNATASLQAQATGGAGGDPFAAFLEQLLERQRRKDREAKTVRAPKQDMTGGPYRMSVGQQRMLANAALPEQTAPQRAVTMTGGLTGSAYRDSMRQMMANDVMQRPQTTYTGFTDLVQALNAGQSGQAAEQAAGAARLAKIKTQRQAVGEA